MSRTAALKRLLTLETLYVLLTLAAVSFALVLIIDPSVLSPAIADEITALATPENLTFALTGAAILLGGYLFWLLGTKQRDDVTAKAINEEEETAQSTRPITGEETTALVEATIEALHLGNEIDPGALRDGLVDRFLTLATQLGYSTEEATSLKESGEWTEDQTAARYIGGPDVGSFSFLERVTAWLFPGRTFEQRYDCSLTAIETFVAEESGFDTPDPDETAEKSADHSRTALRTATPQTQWHARWHGAAFVSLTFATVGFFLAEPTLFLVALLPLGYVGYAAVAQAPDPKSVLTIMRETTTTHPLPGEPVDVSLTLTNQGTTPLTDIRVVDGVPEALTVTDGTASAGFALRGGESKTLSYRVRPQRGTHAFDPVVVRIRSLSGAAIATAQITPEGPVTLQCAVPLDSVPVHRKTIQRVGSVPTDRGGPGLEFHSTREYRHGDPPRWIDWRRFARTAELGTIRYRRQEATTVVALIDGREASAVVDHPGTPDGVTLSVYAGILTTGTLLDAGHQVGLVGLGVRVDGNDIYSGPPVYVPPGEAGVHSARLAEVCDTIADPTTIRGNPLKDDQIDVDRIHSLLPKASQLIVFSPLVDDDIVEAVSTLRRRGFDITVLSPDITRRNAYGARLNRLDRTLRRAELTKLGLPVIDWNPDERLHLTLERLERTSVLVA